MNLFSFHLASVIWSLILIHCGCMLTESNRHIKKDDTLTVDTQDQFLVFRGCHTDVEFSDARWILLNLVSLAQSHGLTAVIPKFFHLNANNISYDSDHIKVLFSDVFDADVFAKYIGNKIGLKVISQSALDSMQINPSSFYSIGSKFTHIAESLDEELDNIPAFSDALLSKALVIELPCLTKQYKWSATQKGESTLLDVLMALTPGPSQVYRVARAIEYLKTLSRTSGKREYNVLHLGKHLSCREHDYEAQNIAKEQGFSCVPPSTIIKRLNQMGFQYEPIYIVFQPGMPTSSFASQFLQEIKSSFNILTLDSLFLKMAVSAPDAAVINYFISLASDKFAGSRSSDISSFITLQRRHLGLSSGIFDEIISPPLHKFLPYFRAPWVFTFSDSSSREEDAMVMVAVHSAIQIGYLWPHCIFMGDSTSPMAQWLSSRGVRMIYHTPTWIDSLWQSLRRRDGGSHLKREHVAKLWLFLDIPLIPQLNFFDFVLFTHIDVIFRKRIDLKQMVVNSNNPACLAMGDDAGVILLKMECAQLHQENLKNWLITSSAPAGTNLRRYDSNGKGALSLFFKDHMSAIHPSYDARPYEVSSYRATLSHIAHFHGPNAFDYSEYMNTGSCPPSFNDLCERGLSNGAKVFVAEWNYALLSAKNKNTLKEGDLVNSYSAEIQSLIRLGVRAWKQQSKAMKPKAAPDNKHQNNTKSIQRANNSAITWVHPNIHALSSGQIPSDYNFRKINLGVCIIGQAQRLEMKSKALNIVSANRKDGVEVFVFAVLDIGDAAYSNPNNGFVNNCYKDSYRERDFMTVFEWTFKSAGAAYTDVILRPPRTFDVAPGSSLFKIFSNDRDELSRSRRTQNHLRMFAHDHECAARIFSAELKMDIKFDMVIRMRDCALILEPLRVHYFMYTFYDCFTNNASKSCVLSKSCADWGGYSDKFWIIPRSLLRPAMFAPIGDIIRGSSYLLLDPPRNSESFVKSTWDFNNVTRYAIEEVTIIPVVESRCKSQGELYGDESKAPKFVPVLNFKDCSTVDSLNESNSSKSRYRVSSESSRNNEIKQKDVVQSDAAIYHIRTPATYLRTDAKKENSKITWVHPNTLTLSSKKLPSFYNFRKINIGVCIIGQAQRFEMKSKALNIVSANKKDGVEVFVFAVLDIGDAAYSNPNDGFVDNCYKDSYRAEDFRTAFESIFKSAGAAYTDVILRPPRTFDVAPGSTLFKIFSHDRDELFRSKRTQHHLRMFAHDHECASRIFSLELKMDIKFDMVLRMRDCALILEPLRVNYFIYTFYDCFTNDASKSCVLSKSCADWGGYSDKFWIIPRSLLRSAMFAPIGDIIRGSSYLLLDPPRNSESFIKSTWDFNNVTRYAIEENDIIPVVESRCKSQGKLNGAINEAPNFVPVPYYKDCSTVNEGNLSSLDTAAHRRLEKVLSGARRDSSLLRPTVETRVD